MKGVNGVQMSVHPKFLKIIKDIQNDRVKKGKERVGELSQKRLSLTVFRRLEQDTSLYKWLTEVDIDRDEV